MTYVRKVRDDMQAPLIKIYVPRSLSVKMERIFTC